MTDPDDAVVQFSLVQLDDYGPWTVTPEPRPEPSLQALQARLYADLADFVGTRDGYVFPGRYDNMIAVSNRITPEQHRRFQELVRNRYPITASVGVGTGATPVDALGAATEALQATGSAQDAARTERLATDRDADPSGPLTVAHFDVVDATGRYTDREHALDAANVPPAIVQIERHPYTPRTELVEFCHERGIRVLAHSPLSAPGLLSEPLLAEIAAERDCSPAEIVVAWNVSEGVVPIPASNDPEHVVDNLHAGSMRLDDSERERIATLSDPEFER